MGVLCLGLGPKYLRVVAGGGGGIHGPPINFEGPLYHCIIQGTSLHEIYAV